MPGIERHETTIDGIGYRMDTLGAVKGSAVALRLLPAFVAGAAQALSMLKPGKSLDKLDWSDLAGAAGGVGAVFEKLSEADLKFVIDTMAAKTLVGVTTEQEKKVGEDTVRWFPLSAIFDEHFAGRYEAMGQWLIWGIRVNGFLGRLSGVLAKNPLSQAAPAAAASSGSPTASTGSAGSPSS